MEITINGQPVTALDITTDEGGITMRLSRLGLGLGVLPVGGAAAPSYTLFIIGGQSNGVGRATYDGLGGHPSGVMQIARSAANAEAGAYLSGSADGALIPAANMLDHWDGISGDMGMSIGFADAWVAANPGETLVLVPAAHGGTSFANGEWDATPGNEYADAVARTNAALTATGGTFGGIIMSLGETDSIATSATFKASAIDMIARARSAISGASAAPVVWCAMPASYENFSAGSVVVQDAIDDLIHSTWGVGVVEGTDIPAVNPATGLPTNDGDTLHWDSYELRVVGDRAYNALLLAQARIDAAPGAPTALVAASDGVAAYLTWTAPTFMGGPVLRYYSVERRVDGGAWSEVAQVAYPATVHADETVTPGTVAEYRVTGISDDYTGTASATASAGTIPATPTTLAVEAFDTGAATTGPDALGKYTFTGLTTTQGGIILAVTQRGSGTTTQTGLTVDGVPATLLITQNNGNSQLTKVYTARATGTTCTVQMDATNSLRCGVAVWSVGAAEISAATAASAFDAANNTTPISATVTSQAGGLVLAHLTYIAAARTHTWTAPLVERVGETVIETTYKQAAADVTTVGVGSVTATETPNANTALKVLVAVAVGPA
jgi:hypothetical protein